MSRVEYAEAFETWFHNDLTTKEQDDVLAIVELLQERGVNLPYPYSSGVRTSKYSHMRELRIQSIR